MVDKSSLRLVIQQPALPHFRVPFFRELASRPGFRVVVYHAGSVDRPNAAPDGFEAHYEPQRHFWLFGSEFLWHSAQWRHLDRARADVACLSWNVRYVSLLPSLLRARARGIPVVLWGHGCSKSDTRHRRRLRSAVASLGSALIFYTQQAADVFQADGWPRERLFVAPNSLDQTEIRKAISAWEDPPGKLAAFRETQGLDRAGTLVFVGRVYKSGFEILLSALARVRNRLPRVKLIVIGKLSEGCSHLETYAAGLGLTDAVRWLGPIYDENEIAPWMLSSSVMCFPRQIGLSLMHGMGYGLPVITDDDLDQHGPEITALRDGCNGRLYRRGSPESLAEVILETLMNPLHLGEMSAAAKRTVETDYTIPRMADGFLAAVRYAAHRRPETNL